MNKCNFCKDSIFELICPICHPELYEICPMSEGQAKPHNFDCGICKECGKLEKIKKEVI